jgi:hypothetical protein
LTTRIRADADARLRAHRRLYGVDMGAILSSLITTYLAEVPEERLPRWPSLGDGWAGAVMGALAAQGLPLDEMGQALAILGGGAPDDDAAADGLRDALMNATSAAFTLSIGLRVLKATQVAPAGADTGAWIRLRHAAIQAAESVLADIGKKA